MSRFCLLLLAALGLVLAPQPSGAENRVAPGFDADFVRATLSSASKPFTCAAPLEPVTDMSGFVSMYDPKDPTQSKVVPERAAHKAARTKTIMRFDLDLGHMADAFLLSRPANAAMADCVISHLTRWAGAEAMTKNMLVQEDEIGRHQAILMQAFHLAGFASAFVKVTGKGGAQRIQPTIASWLEQIAQSVMTEYTTINRWSLKGGNHAYWSGFAVATTGVALNDHRMLDFGIRWLKQGLAQVDGNGALPGELRRGSKSMGYQHFATLPLVGLVTLADANKVPLTEQEENALARLIKFNVTQSKNPRTASALAKAPQPKTVGRVDLAWVDIILPRVRKRDADLGKEMNELVRALRPLHHVYFGGSTTTTYNPLAMVPGAE